MFSTRLRDVAARFGHDCRLVRRAADVPAHLDGTDLVIIDLMVAGGGALEAVTAAREAGVTVVAYGEHVAVDVLQAAREAGADQVLKRSDFARALPSLLGDS
jgi:DNA-binding response OmpR family regulator